MSDEILKRDENSVPVTGAVTNDASLEVRQIRVDPSTNALIITGDITIAEFPSSSSASDNYANPTTTDIKSFGMIWDGATWDRMPGNSTDGTLVNLGANNDVTVTGSVTANAGTNLNTSLLALESGGNLAAIATSASILDDWDESDRAKVNIIVGQAGIAGGTGAVGATTVRTVNGVATSATLANVSSSASSTTLQASNANRIGWSIYNDSTQPVYVKFGATATASSCTVKVPAGGYYEMPIPIYTGIIDGIWASADGAARVTELA